MRLIFAACGLTGRYWVSVDHTCCLWPCKTPETRIVHVYSLSALRLTASVPVDIRPSCLGIRPTPLLFGHYSDFIDDSRPCGTTLAILIVGEPQNHPIRPFLVPDGIVSKSSVRRDTGMHATHFAACGLTGRYWMSVFHTCCLWPCQTPETRIVHVYSLAALHLTASVPVDIRPSCLGIRPPPLLFWH